MDTPTHEPELAPPHRDVLTSALVRPGRWALVDPTRFDAARDLARAGLGKYERMSGGIARFTINNAGAAALHNYSQ